VAAAPLDGADNRQGRDKRERSVCWRDAGSAGETQFGCDNYETNLCVFNRTAESFLGLRVAPADTWQLGLRALSEKRGVTPGMASGLVSSAASRRSACFVAST